MKKDTYIPPGLISAGSAGLLSLFSVIIINLLITIAGFQTLWVRLLITVSSQQFIFWGLVLQERERK